MAARTKADFSVRARRKTQVRRPSAPSSAQSAATPSGASDYIKRPAAPAAQATSRAAAADGGEVVAHVADHAAQVDAHLAQRRQQAALACRSGATTRRGSKPKYSAIAARVAAPVVVQRKKLYDQTRSISASASA